MLGRNSKKTYHFPVHSAGAMLSDFTVCPIWTYQLVPCMYIPFVEPGVTVVNLPKVQITIGFNHYESRQASMEESGEIEGRVSMAGCLL